MTMSSAASSRVAVLVSVGSPVQAELAANPAYIAVSQELRVLPEIRALQAPESNDQKCARNVLTRHRRS